MTTPSAGVVPALAGRADARAMGRRRNLGKLGREERQGVSGAGIVLVLGRGRADRLLTESEHRPIAWTTDAAALTPAVLRDRAFRRFRRRPIRSASARPARAARPRPLGVVINAIVDALADFGVTHIGDAGDPPNASGARFMQRCLFKAQIPVKVIS